MKHLIRNIPDFPEPGVIFRDITPLIADGEAFKEVIDSLAAKYQGKIDAVAGVEARGFLFAAPLAYALGIGMLVVRKVGKLAPPTISRSYELEYGTADVEVSVGTVTPGSRVLVLDDVLATGGTAAATCSLLEEAGAEVIGTAFLLELPALQGRKQLSQWPTYSLMSF